MGIKWIFKKQGVTLLPPSSGWRCLAKFLKPPHQILDPLPLRKFALWFRPLCSCSHAQDRPFTRSSVPIPSVLSMVMFRTTYPTPRLLLYFLHKTVIMGVFQEHTRFVIKHLLIQPSENVGENIPRSSCRKQFPDYCKLPAHTPRTPVVTFTWHCTECYWRYAAISYLNTITNSVRLFIWRLLFRYEFLSYSANIHPLIELVVTRVTAAMEWLVLLLNITVSSIILFISFWINSLTPWEADSR